MTELDDARDWAAGELREGVALHRLLAHALDATQREGLRRVALVVLRPHALEAGDGAAIVRHLAEEHGARPVALRVLPRLGPALAEALYRRQAKIPRGRMWLQQAAYGSGPVAALLVAEAQAGERPLTERLYASKGPTSALAGAPDSLRARFGRTSSLHAVVHVPDDLRALVLEASLFFDWATVRGAGAAPPIGLDLVAPLVTLEPAPGRLVFQAVLKVKRRILAAVAIAAGRDVVGALVEAATAADAELEGLAYLAQRDRMLAFAKAERSPLAAAIAQLELGVRARSAATRAQAWGALRAATAPVELLSASWMLSGHEPYGGDGGERLFATLDCNGVPLSESQRALLAAALATDLNPAASVDGERLWPLGPDPAR